MTLNHYLKKESLLLFYGDFPFLVKDQFFLLQILIPIFSSVAYLIGHMEPRLGSVSITTTAKTAPKPTRHKNDRRVILPYGTRLAC